MHALLDFADELERRSDLCAKAWEDEAEAENSYDYVHAIAYAKAAADGVAATMRAKHADAMPEVVAAHAEFRQAQARARARKLKFEACQAASMLQMAYVKQMGMQDGGPR